MKKLLSLRLNRFVPSGLLALAAAVLLAPAAADATPYIVKLTQQGNNVVASGSGEFDLISLTKIATAIAAGPGMSPVGGTIETGPGGVAQDYYLGGVTGPAGFGNGLASFANAGSGDEVTFNGGPRVPQGYISGSALASSATWLDATFASLGVTPGIYVWKWGSGTGDQTFTLDIVRPVGVPEPAALGLFGFGVLLIGAFVGLQRRLAWT